VLFILLKIGEETSMSKTRKELTQEIRAEVSKKYRDEITSLKLDKIALMEDNIELHCKIKELERKLRAYEDRDARVKSALSASGEQVVQLSKLFGLL
jgi:hypothetical protein